MKKPMELGVPRPGLEDSHSRSTTDWAMCTARYSDTTPGTWTRIGTLLKTLPVLLAVLLFRAGSLQSQASAKIDSLRVLLTIPYDQAYQDVAATMTAQGFTITNSTPITIEADAGMNMDQLSPSLSYHRKVRATLLRQAVGVVVQITGTETREARGDNAFLRELRIDDHAKGNGGKVWRKMVAVAAGLDSIDVRHRRFGDSVARVDDSIQRSYSERDRADAREHRRRDSLYSDSVERGATSWLTEQGEQRRRDSIAASTRSDARSAIQAISNGEKEYFDRTGSFTASRALVGYKPWYMVKEEITVTDSTWSANATDKTGWHCSASGSRSDPSPNADDCTK